MRGLKAKAKVTQAMTRDGLTLENQATGEMENISSQEAEQNLSAPGLGGIADRLLERADTIHDGHKAKKVTKQAGAVAVEGDAAPHRPSAWLQLSEEERADPDLQSYIRKSDKRADKLDKARVVIPKERAPVREAAFDETSGKAEIVLHLDKQDKGLFSLKPNPAGRPVFEVFLFGYGKIHEVEHENVDVEGGHKGEELAERQAGKTIRSTIRHHRLKPYQDVEKAECRLLSANAKYFYQKSLRDNPEIAQVVSNPIPRFWQKQQTKCQYAKVARIAGQTVGAAAQGAAKTAGVSTKAAKVTAKESERAASFVVRHWKGALAVLALGLLMPLIIGGLQSRTAMFGSAGSGITASSYFSEDSDMLAVEDVYAELEVELQDYLDNHEATHDYDEYHFDLDETSHDLYVLISILLVLHNGIFIIGEVQGDLSMLSDKQYILTENIVAETRYRTETDTWTGTEGNIHTDTYQVSYDYYICYIMPENFDLSHVPVYIMDEETLGFHSLYVSTLGNQSGLFSGSQYLNASTLTPPTYYDVPPKALEDATFVAMFKETEKYIGYPYVWGGSSPNTSFDCSGFVSWVISHSGWNVGRLGAQGLYNTCTPTSSSQVKPGDLVFFKRTYDTPGVSRVGLHVSNNAMLHCGNLISYTDLTSNYWQPHFYSYGRLP